MKLMEMGYFYFNTCNIGVKINFAMKAYRNVVGKFEFNN